MDNDQIVQYLESLDKEASEIKSELLRICWYMRGSINYDDAMILDRQEKSTIGKMIKENLETTKKSGMPFF